MSGDPADVWAAAVPSSHRHGTRHHSGQGRGPDAAFQGGLSVQARLRTRDEEWAVAAKGRQIQHPPAGFLKAGALRRAGWDCQAVCREAGESPAESTVRTGAAGRGYSVGLSYMR
jgi:hypothetical protein